jgi:transcription elongation factor GreA
MRVPIRKGDARAFTKPDLHLTQARYDELTAKLDRMISVDRPRLAEEVKRLALMGDFSENAGYQLAKGRLRGLNQRILDTEYLLKRAEIIRPSADTSRVRIGHLVTIENRGQLKTYRILGGTETDPTRGIISHNSPLGSALIGKCVGESISIGASDRLKEYKIIKIE